MKSRLELELEQMGKDREQKLLSGEWTAEDEVDLLELDDKVREEKALVVNAEIEAVRAIVRQKQRTSFGMQLEDTKILFESGALNQRRVIECPWITRKDKIYVFGSEDKLKEIEEKLENEEKERKEKIDARWKELNDNAMKEIDEREKKEEEESQIERQRNTASRLDFEETMREEQELQEYFDKQRNQVLSVLARPAVEINLNGKKNEWSEEDITAIEARQDRLDDSLNARMKWLKKAYNAEEAKLNEQQNEEEHIIMGKSLKGKIKSAKKYAQSGEFKHGFVPLVDIAIDIVKTGNPYTSWYYVGKDFIQPIRGIGNMLAGIIGATGSVVGLPFLPLLALSTTEPFRNNYYTGGSVTENARKIVEYQTAGYFKRLGIRIRYDSGEGIASLALILKGAVQILTTPLTWFIKMPTRGILTYKKNKNYGEKTEYKFKVKEERSHKPVEIRDLPTEGLGWYARALVNADNKERRKLAQKKQRNSSNEKELEKEKEVLPENKPRSGM